MNAAPSLFVIKTAPKYKDSQPLSWIASCLSAALVATATMRCPCVIVDEPDYDTRHSGNDDTWYLTFILISLISFKRLILSLESIDPFQFYSVIILAPCKGNVCDFLLVMFWLQNC